MARIAGATFACALIACAPRAKETPEPAAIRSETQPSVLRLTADPTVPRARLLPETLDPRQSYGVDPEGASRFLAGGLRLLGLPNGGTRTAGEPLPESSKTDPAAYALPTRLGGGFLFVVQPSLYRAETWLSRVKPFYSAPS